MKWYQGLYYKRMSQLLKFHHANNRVVWRTMVEEQYTCSQSAVNTRVSTLNTYITKHRVAVTYIIFRRSHPITNEQYV